MRRYFFLLIFLLSVPVMSWGQVQELRADSVTTDTTQRISKFQQMKQDFTKRINDKLNEPYDTTRDNRYWWRAMKHGKVNFNDSTMGYPKFVKFCYKTYKWVDRAFNSYDTAYVVGTGKNWKLTLKNQNWFDNFSGGEGGKDYASFTSGLASNIGLHLSFMAVSVGYSLDIDRIFGAKGTSEMLEFSFTCARFTAEVRKTTNTGRMRTRVNLDGDGWKSGNKLNALRRETMGVNATYFFNNRKYARAAAYCYSKYQKRSAGSPLAGFSIVNYDFKVDKDQFTPEQAKDFELVGVEHVRYTDYCLRGGYAYNWVINPKFLFNATGLAGAGVKHIHSTSSMASANSGALSMGADISITYNHKRYFASLQGNVNTSLYISGKWHFTYTIAGFSTVLGLRF